MPLFLMLKVFGGEGFDMGDLQFLRDLAIAGNLIIITGSRSTTGEILSYTPANGKSFFFYKAGVTTSDTSTGTGTALVEIRNDGTAKDYLGGSDPQGGGPSLTKVESTIMADKLIGNGTKKYSLHLTVFNDTSLTIYGSMEGWIEDS